MARTRWLTDDQRLAWIRFAAVIELLPRELDGQLTRDEQLSHFDYFALAMLSEAPDRTMRLTALASMTNATLPRLSRVMSRLEDEGYVRREPCPGDKRSVNLVLTDHGWHKVVHAAPGHVAIVRSLVIDALRPEQISQLSEICTNLLAVLDPDQKVMASALHPNR